MSNPRAVYRTPLSLSIFQGATDYLVTDGPFAYPLDLWLFDRDARGPEPIRRSISSSLLDSPMLLTLSSLPSVWDLFKRSARRFLPSLLSSPLGLLHVTGILSCISSTAIVPLFSSLLYSPVVGYPHVSFLFLFPNNLCTSFSFSQSVTFGVLPLLFPRVCLSLSCIATTDAILFRD